jgi:tetratricopeptide (TPR) repeat protein
LKKYVAQKPGDLDALVRFGLVLEELAWTPDERGRALLVLENVLRRDPTRHDLRRHVARAALSREQYDDAQSHLEYLLRETKPVDGELLVLLGRTHEALGQFSKAERFYRDAIAIAPTRIDSYERLAHMLRDHADQLMDTPRGESMAEGKKVSRGKNMDSGKRVTRSREALLAEADKLMDQLVKANETSAHAYLARRMYRRISHSDDPATAQDLARARELAPDDVEVLLVTAMAQEAEGRRDEARRTYERALAKYASDDRIYWSLAALENRAGRRDQALAALRRGLDAVTVPSGRALLELAQADTLIMDGQWDVAKKEIEHLRTEGIFPIFLGYLEAQIVIHDKNYRQAVKGLRSLLRVIPELSEESTRQDLTKKTELLLGRCLGSLGDPEQQLAAYRRAVAADPSWDPAGQALIATLAFQGRLDEALDESRKALLKSPRQNEERLELVRLLIRKNALLPEVKRKWDEVERLLDEAERTQPELEEVTLLRADVLTAQRQFDRARGLLENARDRHPERLEFWTTALASVARQQGESGQALEMLDQAERRLGDTAGIRLARLEVWSDRRGPETRTVLEALQRGLEKFSEPDRLRLRNALAAAYLNIDDPGQARRLLTQVAESRPDDPTMLNAWLQLIELSFRDRDAEAMKPYLAHLRTIEGEGGPHVLFGEALRLYLLGRFAEVRARLADITRQRPKWPEVPSLEALIADSEGHVDLALRGYLKAIELGNDNPRVVNRAVQVLRAQARYVEADLILRRLQERGALRRELAKLATEICLLTPNPDHSRALALARTAVPAASQDYLDHVWLGMIFWTMKRNAEAEASLRHAIELSGDAPEPRAALVGFLGQSGRVDQAEAVIQETQRQVRPDRAPLAVALCYETLDRQDRAEEWYRKALAVRPGDAITLKSAANFFMTVKQFSKAEPLFRKLIDPATKASAGDVTWARRCLAVGLASGGDAQRSAEALSIVKLNFNPIGTLSDQRAQAIVLAAQGHGAQAIRIFEDVARQSELPLSEQFVLAQLYLAGDRWPKAHDLMQSLLLSGNRDPDYLAFFVENLLRRHQVDEAQPWLRKLEQVAPQDFRTIKLKATLLEELGQRKQAAELLATYARGRDSEAGTIAPVLDRVDHAAAERLYRKAAESGRPEASLDLIQNIARQGRIDEALDLCEGERVWQTYPAEDVAKAILNVLLETGANEKQCLRVEGWLKDALRKNPDSLVLPIQQANLDTLRGRYDDAVKVYRGIYERDKSNAVVLNNLALLLSYENGKESEAVALIEDAIRLAGPHPALLETRGSIQVRVGGPLDKAIDDLEQAVKEIPTAEVYFDLACAYRKRRIRGRELARDAFQKATSLGLKRDRLHALDRPIYDQFVAARAPN